MSVSSAESRELVRFTLFFLTSDVEAVDREDREENAVDISKSEDSRRWLLEVQHEQLLLMLMECWMTSRYSFNETEMQNTLIRVQLLKYVLQAGNKMVLNMH